MAEPGTIKAYSKFEAIAYFLKKEEGGKKHEGEIGTIQDGYQPQFFIQTASVTGSIKMPEGKEFITQGEETKFRVELISSVAMEENNKFIIREGGRTVGGGTIIKLIE